MKHENGSFELSKSECRALLAFASRDATREQLTALHCDPPRGRITATDGHTMAILRNGTTHTLVPIFVVPRAAVDAASKALRKTDDRLIIERDGDNIRLRAVSGGIESVSTVLPLAGAEIQFDEVVPKPAEFGCKRVGLDATYLARLALVQKAAAARSIIAHACPSDSTPSRYTCESPSASCDWTVVIMPVRI